MKTHRNFLLSLFLISGFATNSQAEVFGFSWITNNSLTNCNTGEAQLSMEVTQYDSTTVSFLFSNLGPLDSSITDIYFDFGTTPNYLAITPTLFDQSSGVSFSLGATPANLPGGTSYGFGAHIAMDSNSPVQPNGINPLEWLDVHFSLLAGSTFDDLLAELHAEDLSVLRVGMHVQGFANGGSEAFINDGGDPSTPVPAPTTIALLGIGLASLGLIRRRNKHSNAT